MIRRPIRARDTRWAHAVAAFLAARRVKCNWISAAGVVFSLAAGAAFAATRFVGAPWAQVALLLAAAACIQLRLLCNLFDGMVAIEGGMKTASGELYNDFPDRLSDPLTLIGAGYAVTLVPWAPVLGWLAALLAVLTATVRVLAGSAGAPQRFLGPMAKQHRMALMTAAAVGSTVECWWGLRGWVLFVALGIVVLGCVVTVVRRFRAAVGDLEHGG